MNINNAVDKAFETKSLKEIANSPVDALQGISEAKGKLLEEALGIKTISDLANNKYIKWAQAISILAEREE